MDVSKDYYAILGVMPTAEDIVIRAAYKALAQRYHPDRFDGSPIEANRRMAEINEAYSILHTSGTRAEYDKLRGHGTQSGESYFQDNGDSAPSYDPLEKEWKTAIKYYPDLKDLDERLSKIAWRLAYSFRAFLIEQKRFGERHKIADSLEEEFLQIYFGKNETLVGFARCLIMRGNKSAAKALNEAVNILGSSIAPAHLIKQIVEDYPDAAACQNRWEEVPSNYATASSFKPASGFQLILIPLIVVGIFLYMVIKG